MEESAVAIAAGHTVHPWGPIVVNRPGAAERQLLKVVAFNARGGRSVEQISERLRRPPLSFPDVILLSEMDWRTKRSGRREAAAELAAELGMSFAYIGEFGLPPTQGKPVAFLGSAILSNWPLTEVCVLPLTKTMTRRRIVRLLGAPAGLAAKVMVNSRPLALGVVHLNSRWNPSGRALQIRQFLQGFPHGAPGIIGGDFNTTTVELSSRAAFVRAMMLALMRPHRFRNPQKWEPLFEGLSEAGFDVTGANLCGKPTFTPFRLVPPIVRPKLDWLALRGLKPIADSAAVVPARTSWLMPRFSDHDFVTCMVEAS
jgi:endonuclease/exonuclease/phosphatase family metal-dependent hydrolase